jgi:LysR family transcriptional regulator, regulator for genes of the gallate degradation pathway
MLSLKQARVIDSVARCAELSRAAEELNMSQSTVSRSLAAAETLLAVPLFRRGWSGAEPTSEGEIVATSCSKALRLIRNTELQLGELSHQTPRIAPYLEWRHLDAIDLVVRLGSASKAANHLKISQPAVSRILKEINSHARQPIFRRLRNGLEPLDPARSLSRLKAQLVAELSGIPNLIDCLSEEVTGRISVGILPFSDQEAIYKVFGKLSGEYPHLRLHALHGTYDMLAEALVRDEIDCFVGVLRQPSPYKDLKEITLCKEFYTLIADAKNKCHDLVSSFDDLMNQQWVVGARGTPPRAYFENLFAELSVTPPVQTCEILSFNAAEQVLVDTDLIALLMYSEKNRKGLRSDLKVIDIELPNAETLIGLTIVDGREITVPLQLFITKLKKRLK